MGSTTVRNRYDARNVHIMESVYGEGFLSPGGAEEVARIVAPLRLARAEVLDLGCGLGGASIALARDPGAGHVTGVDIDPALLERAASLVAGAGLDARVTLRAIRPGALPFAGGRFDLVYAGAVTCHVEALRPFFAEVMRVLRPGACFTGAEWFTGRDAGAFAQWDDLLRAQGLDFHFVTRDAFREVLASAGFEAVSFTDRSDAMAALAARALARVQGEVREEIEHTLGAEGRAAFARWAASRATALGRGGIHYGHFRARRPA